MFMFSMPVPCSWTVKNCLNQVYQLLMQIFFTKWSYTYVDIDMRFDMYAISLY